MQPVKTLRYYTTPSGTSPFVRWLNGIRNKTSRARIERRLERLEHGYYGDTKAIGEGIHELRFDMEGGYRVYFAQAGDVVIILLCAGNKSSQARDIKHAKQYWKELKGRLT